MGDQDNTGGSLRMFTTLTPDLPHDYFETLRQYLQQQISRDIVLQSENNWRGPEVDENPSPFDHDQADIGFIPSIDYVRAKIGRKNTHFERLPVGPLHRHPNSDGKPVYFSDVVLHTGVKERLTDFQQARGTVWAYSTSRSLSGSLYPRHHFRKEGENTSFFGDTREAGSHIAAIEMVRDKRAEGATVNSAVVFSYFQRNPQARNDIFVKLSLGPLPIYPIVVKKKLSDEIKQQLKNAFLSISQNQEMKAKLDPYGVDGFVVTYEEMYNLEQDILKDLKKPNLSVPFY